MPITGYLNEPWAGEGKSTYGNLPEMLGPTAGLAAQIVILLLCPAIFQLTLGAWFHKLLLLQATPRPETARSRTLPPAARTHSPAPSLALLSLLLLRLGHSRPRSVLQFKGLFKIGPLLSGCFKACCPSAPPPAKASSTHADLPNGKHEKNGLNGHSAA